MVDATKPVIYFFGPDAEGVRDEVEACFLETEGEKLRVDVAEIGRLVEWFSARGLFEAHAKVALVRDVSRIRAEEQARLLRLFERLEPPQRLILCAPAVDVRKAHHQAIVSHPQVDARRIDAPSLEGFTDWLAQTLQHQGVHLEEEALIWASERLFGMRKAARAFVERASLYLGGEERPLTREETAALLGERAPRSLDEWLHALMQRSPKAVPLARELLADGVAAVQMLAWLATRLEQLLLYLWHRAKRTPRPLQAAGVFGTARQWLPQEAAHWTPKEAVQALMAVEETERGIKGASAEPEAAQLEALIWRLLERSDEHA